MLIIQYIKQNNYRNAKQNKKDQNNLKTQGLEMHRTTQQKIKSVDDKFLINNN